VTSEHLLFRRVNIASLVAFRIAFGAIVIWEVTRYLERGWVLEYYVDPIYRFPYEGFEWVSSLPALGMIGAFAFLGLCAFFLMAGYFYRIAATLVFLGLAYVFLLEQAVYLNHFYLVVLIGFLMILVPAHHAYSLDATLKRVPRREWTPAWSIHLLRFQLGIVYFFGGIAKLNRDWMVEGEPLRHWLGDSTGFPLVGPLFDEPWAPYVVGWSGLLIDLSAPFLLLHQRTRPFMFTTLLAFHFINDRLFSIGIFPWFAIAATTIFFPPDWPQRFAAACRAHRVSILSGGAISLLIGLYMHRGFELVPALVAGLGGGLVVWTFLEGHGHRVTASNAATEVHEAAGSGRKLVLGFLMAWAAVQILVPLRHYVIPGDVAWTEEGHRFSWRMKLRSKHGLTRFYAYDPVAQNGYEIRVDTLLTEKQYDEMAGRPHMIIQFARYLDGLLAAEGKANYQVRVAGYAIVNYGPPGLIVDPSVDLTAQSYSDFRHNAWIRPRPRPRE
jgi:vitamin K-dependent gamma-carboxylase